MKGTRIAYTAEELAWLETNRMLVISDYHREFREAFPDSVASLDNLHALRKRRGWKTGRTGQFTRGNVSHNKGKVCPPGVGGRHPNAQRTQFRKGQLPHNTKFIGHERVNVDGYVEISVAETNPHTGYERRYVHKHVRLWQQANGPVPEGYCLKCKDGDRTNSAPSNWELIPRAIIPRLNGGPRKTHLAYDQASPEVRPALIAIAKIDHHVRKALRKKGNG